MHSLRHTYATRCVEAEVDVAAIKEDLGHKDISTTMNIYADVFEEHRRKQLGRAETYLKENGLSFYQEKAE